MPVTRALLLAGVVALGVAGFAGSAHAEESRATVSPVWMDLKLAASLEIAGVGRDESAEPEEFRGGVELPEPAQAGGGGRISRGGGSRNRRKFDERRLGIAFVPGWAMLTGEVVGKAFGPGPVGTIRLLVNASTATQVFFDLSYSTHPMKDPTPMFFRTAVTKQSHYSGQMNVICPAVFYAATLPIGADFHRKAFFIPKLYIGLGPLISLASGKVTNAGTKGTVTGSGTQPFIQFTPGLAFDVRVAEFVFVGVDFKYRVTIPTVRANETKEFSIPKMYVFESGLSASYFFW